MNDYSYHTVSSIINAFEKSVNFHFNTQITDSILNASKLHIPPHIYKPYKNPYWKDDVKEARKQA